MISYMFKNINRFSFSSVNKEEMDIFISIFKYFYYIKLRDKLEIFHNIIDLTSDN